MKVVAGQITPTLEAVRKKPRRSESGPGFAPQTGSTSGAPERPGHARHLAVLLFAVGLASCRSGSVNDPVPGAASGAAGSAPVRHSAPLASDRKPPFPQKPWHIPVGPTLLIQPNKGLGPIRFGATRATIERLIGEPCEDVVAEGVDSLCRYSAQAIDFVLRDGALSQVRAHRLGRPFKPGSKADYGIFNGAFESGVTFGMLPSAVRELLGAPKQVRAVTGDNPNHTIEVHEYDNFSLEFDRISPESVVLGGVVLTAPPGTSPG